MTLESLELIKDIMERHGPEFDEEDLDATKSFLIKNNARAFETLGSKLGILADMTAYGFPADYVLQREAVVHDMTIERVRELADRYLDPTSMVWLVVGTLIGVTLLHAGLLRRADRRRHRAGDGAAAA